MKFKDNELVKKAFWKFPFLDGILALIIAVISMILSVSDNSALFGIPGLVALGGFIFLLGSPASHAKGRTSREEAQKDMLYGARAIIISVLATLVILVLQAIGF